MAFPRLVLNVVPFAAALATLAVAASACMTIVRPGEIGVRDTLGQQSSTVSESGIKLYLWPVWDITKVSTQLTNLRVSMSLPSKEGLTIESEISILYSVSPKHVPLIPQSGRCR